MNDFAEPLSTGTCDATSMGPTCVHGRRKNVRSMVEVRSRTSSRYRLVSRFEFIGHPGNGHIAPKEGFELTKVGRIQSLNMTDICVCPPLSQFFKIDQEHNDTSSDEIETMDAISPLIDSGCSILPLHLEGCWVDTEKPEHVLEANRLILDGIEAWKDDTVEDCASVIGRVKIGNRAVIFGSSVLRGPSIVGEVCRIG